MLCWSDVSSIACGEWSQGGCGGSRTNVGWVRQNQTGFFQVSSYVVHILVGGIEW